MTIAILGATGTIGSTIARSLAASRQSVLLLGRNEDKLATLGAELDQPFAVVESASSQSLDAALAKHESTNDRFSGFVNCAGTLLLKPAHLTTDDEFRQTVEANLFTAFALVRAAIQRLRGDGGSIVLVASAAAEIGIANHEAIAAAKAGVIGLARSAAATYSPHNIRVNVVSPGLVRTQLTNRICTNAAALRASTELHALGRIGRPEDVASLILWLLDPRNDWITGQVIGIDGGLSRVQPRRSPPEHSGR